MKVLLTLICVTCLIGVTLFPLLMSGLGRPLNWLLEVAFLIAGTGSLYLLVRYRKSL